MYKGMLFKCPIPSTSPLAINMLLWLKCEIELIPNVFCIPWLCLGHKKTSIELFLHSLFVTAYKILQLVLIYILFFV